MISQKAVGLQKTGDDDDDDDDDDEWDTFTYSDRNNRNVFICHGLFWICSSFGAIKLKWWTCIVL